MVYWNKLGYWTRESYKKFKVRTDLLNYKEEKKNWNGTAVSDEVTVVAGWVE